jgi:hypothetical protein
VGAMFSVATAEFVSFMLFKPKISCLIKFAYIVYRKYIVVAPSFYVSPRYVLSRCLQ